MTAEVWTDERGDRHRKRMKEVRKVRMMDGKKWLIHNIVDSGSYEKEK